MNVEITFIQSLHVVFSTILQEGIWSDIFQ